MIMYLRIVFYSIFFYYIVSIVNPSSDVDVKAEPFHNEYIYLLKKYCKSSQYSSKPYKINFKNFGGETIGTCSINALALEVTLDIKFWKKGDDTAKFNLISHELTHCFFNQKHVDNPDHYMAPYYKPIEKEILVQQIRDFLKDKCNGQKIRSI